MKKKILILTSKIPYPLTDGGIVSQYAFTDILRHDYEISYLFLVSTDEHFSNMNALRQQWPNVAITFVDIRFTNLENNRLDVVEKILLKLQFWYTKLMKNKISRPIQKVVDSENSEFRYPTRFIPPIPPLYIASLHDLLIRLQPDLIQVEHIPFMNLVFSLPKSIKKIYIHHELQFARIQSVPVSETGGSYKQYVESLVENIERAILSHYTAVLTFSDIDKVKLDALLNLETPVFSSPYPVLTASFEEVTNKDFVINKLVFVGSDSHPPNLDAVLWYAEEIGPIVKKQTGMDLFVTGKWSDFNKDMINKFGCVQFVGFIPDLTTYLRGSIMVVPVRVGSGIRTKILYAMAQSLPVVSARIGIEGIEVASGKEAIVVDTAVEMASAIISLYQNKEKAWQLGNSGYKFALKNYSQSVLCERRTVIYKLLHG